MVECSICGQSHSEYQTWLYGCGYLNPSEKKAHTASGNTYGTCLKNVRYGKLTVCRNCEDISRITYEIEKKRSIALCVITLLIVLLIYTILYYVKTQHYNHLITMSIFVSFIYGLAFRRLPPKNYPPLQKSNPIDFKEPLTPLDNIVRTVKRSFSSADQFCFWTSSVDQIISHRASNPKPAIPAAQRLNHNRYHYFLAVATKHIEKGEYYKAIIRTMLFKNKVPVPESFLVLGYIYEKLGRPKEALSAYSLSSWLLVESEKPDQEIGRLREQLSCFTCPTDKSINIFEDERNKIIAKVRLLLDKHSKRKISKAAKLLWNLLLTDDPEGVRLYTKAMERLNLSDKVENTKNVAS